MLFHQNDTEKWIKGKLTSGMISWRCFIAVAWLSISFTLSTSAASTLCSHLIELAPNAHVTAKYNRLSGTLCCVSHSSRYALLTWHLGPHIPDVPSMPLIFLLCFLKWPLLFHKLLESWGSISFSGNCSHSDIFCLGGCIHYLDFNCQLQTKETKCLALLPP